MLLFFYSFGYSHITSSWLPYLLPKCGSFSRRVFSWGRTSTMSISLCPVLWVLFHHMTARPVPWDPPSPWSFSPGSLLSWVTFVFLPLPPLCMWQLQHKTCFLLPSVFLQLCSVTNFPTTVHNGPETLNHAMPYSISSICPYLGLYLGQKPHIKYTSAAHELCNVESFINSSSLSRKWKWW